MASPFMATFALTPADTNLNLWTLVKVVDSAFPQGVSEIRFQADATLGGSEDIRIGNTDLSDTNFGIELDADESARIGPQVINGIDLNTIFVRTSEDTKTLSVVIVVQ